MTESFLLRFQEPCLPNASGMTSSGTHTVTKIAAEQPDADANDQQHGVLQQRQPRPCTPTKTAIQAEGPDYDARSHATSVIPRNLSAQGPGTMTITAVHAEATDNDLTHENMRALPRRS